MYKVLIMNANGSGTEGLRVGGLDIPKKRDTARLKVIKDENPDLILIQESDILLNKYCKQDIGNRKYNFIGEKDPGIIYDKTKFYCLENPTDSLRAIYDSILPNQKMSSDNFFQRMCATILREKKIDAQKFLCVSWHGPHYKMTNERKTNIFHHLCLIITQYLDKKQIPVILGGDFNLNLTCEKLKISSLLSHYHLRYHNYDSLDHHKNKIDYIITSETIIIGCCKPVDAFETIPELTLPILKDFFDHDPVVVNVTIPCKGNEISKSSKVLIMNSNGKVNSMNFPDIRRDVRNKVIENEGPDLILLQETDNSFTKINYDTTQFEEYKNSQDTKLQLKELYSNNSTTEIGERKIPEDKFFERMCAIVMQEKVPNAQPFLFVSWNGPNNHQKVRITNDLIRLLRLYSKEYKIPLILGGDFCLDLSKMKGEDPPIPDGLQLNDYTLLPHRTNKSDFLLTSQSLKCENCKPCDVIKFMDELREIIRKAILDHDPLVVSFTLPNHG